MQILQLTPERHAPRDTSVARYLRAKTRNKRLATIYHKVHDSWMVVTRLAGRAMVEHAVWGGDPNIPRETAIRNTIEKLNRRTLIGAKAWRANLLAKHNRNLTGEAQDRIDNLVAMVDWLYRKTRTRPPTWARPEKGRRRR